MNKDGYEQYAHACTATHTKVVNVVFFASPAIKAAMPSSPMPQFVKLASEKIAPTRTIQVLKERSLRR
jgi:hypothetical protein